MNLPEFRNIENLPKIEGKKLKNVVPRLGKPGLDLLEKFLQYDPLKRISAKDAMM